MATKAAIAVVCFKDGEQVADPRVCTLTFDLLPQKGDTIPSLIDGFGFGTIVERTLVAHEQRAEGAAEALLVVHVRAEDPVLPVPGPAPFNDERKPPPEVEQGTLYVNGSCLGPAERDPKSGRISAGPHIKARRKRAQP